MAQVRSEDAFENRGLYRVFVSGLFTGGTIAPVLGGLERGLQPVCGYEIQIALPIAEVVLQQSWGEADIVQHSSG